MRLTVVLSALLCCALPSSAGPPAKDGVYATSWMGKGMELNQDNMKLSPQTGVFAIGDGENQAGEVASAFAVNFAINFLSDPQSVNEPARREAETIQYLFNFAGEEVAKVRAIEPRYRKAACSLGVLWLRKGHAWFARAGEIRFYRLYQGKLESVLGPYRKKSEDLHGQKSVKAELHRVKTRPGEVYALCTDGVYKVLGPKQLETILLKSLTRPLESTADSLADAVVKKGSPDNFTLILVRSPPD
jgi:serine/threonine protein phosphatase PrpC